MYTEETLPLKPIVSEVRGGGVSEKSDGCLGDCVAGFARSDYSSGKAGSHWATVFLPRGRGKKIVVIHSVNQGVRIRTAPGAIPGGWRERIALHYRLRRRVISPGITLQQRKKKTKKNEIKQRQIICDKEVD